MRVSFLIAGLLATCFAMASEFERPWVSPGAPLILDCYHANGIDWNLLATEPRVVAIIHKATTGSRKLDPQYLARRKEAASRGYLWGSYHLGMHGNPEKQADFYLKSVKAEENELLALDLEDVTSARYMNAAEAVRFIKRVKQRTGRYPVLYVNARSARVITEKHRHPVFTNTPLWYAKFAGSLDPFPRGPWPSYTLWQFSSEILTQQAVPGTAYDMDVNVFNGTMDDLRAQWPLTKCETTTRVPKGSPGDGGTQLLTARLQ
jgi:GH25 family lysozyme M1 (1,4-beta-N-acetylmuramidase)